MDLNSPPSSPDTTCRELDAQLQRAIAGEHIHPVVETTRLPLEAQIAIPSWSRVALHAIHLLDVYAFDILLLILSSVASLQSRLYLLLQTLGCIFVSLSVMIYVPPVRAALDSVSTAITRRLPPRYAALTPTVWRRLFLTVILSAALLSCYMESSPPIARQGSFAPLLPCPPHMGDPFAETHTWQEQLDWLFGSLDSAQASIEQIHGAIYATASTNDFFMPAFSIIESLDSLTFTAEK